MCQGLVYPFQEYTQFWGLWSCLLSDLLLILPSPIPTCTVLPSSGSSASSARPLLRTIMKRTPLYIALPLVFPPTTFPAGPPLPAFIFPARTHAQAGAAYHQAAPPRHGSQRQQQVPLVIRGINPGADAVDEVQHEGLHACVDGLGRV